MTTRSSRHNVNSDIGFVAFKNGDAVRVDMYFGRTKAKNFAYYLDATIWPDTPIDQLNMAHYLFRNPTLLDGPTLRGDKPSFWDGRANRYAGTLAKAINEVTYALD